MKKKNRQGARTLIITGAAAVLMSGLMFGGLTLVAEAAVFNQTKTVTTNVTPVLENTSLSTPLGYVKSNYHVKVVENQSKPAQKDMPAKAAAELGAKNLWRLFGVTLENQTIFMSYEPANVSQPRATWYGEVQTGQDQNYVFQIDAVTGEYEFTSSWAAGKENKNNIKIDEKTGRIADQYKRDEFIKLAKQIALDKGLLTAPITSAKYDQDVMAGGYTMIDVHLQTGDGQEVQLTLSPYSNRLISVTYKSELLRQSINMQK